MTEKNTLILISQEHNDYLVKLGLQCQHTKSEVLADMITFCGKNSKYRVNK